MSVAYGKGDKGKATRLHSLLVRSRGRCERCGETRYDKLTTAHMIPRRFSATRTMEEASWCLCYSCHRLTEQFPDEFLNLVGDTIGLAEYLRLKLLAQTPTKKDWQAEAERLAARCKELGIETRRSA